MSELLFTSNQTARTRHETVGGIEYLIAPVVAIKAGVMNGELIPAEEIQHHVAAWNGSPFVVGHPKDADGNGVSANDPALLAQLQIGRLFNAKFESRAGKGEIWIDLSKAKLVDGGPEVVGRLESGKPLEISTAYLRDRDEKPGTLDGVEYGAVARNLRPDHLAALLDAEGACSWADGCGAPRVNQETYRCECLDCGHVMETEEHCADIECPECGGEMRRVERPGPGRQEGDMEANVLGKARRPTYSGTTDAPWEAPTLAGWLAAYPGPKPNGNRVADLPQAAKNWIAAHTLLGDPRADNERDLAFFPVVTPQGKLSGGAVRAVLGGRGIAAKIPQAAKESAQAIARALLEKEFKADAANESRVLCALRTIAGAFGIEFNQDTEVNKMEELIKAILEDGRLGLNEEQLQTLDEDVLGILVKALKTMPKAAEPKPEPESNDDEQEAGLQEEEEKEARPEANEALQALGDRITALETAAQAGDKERKVELVTALASNATCTLTGEQLEALDVATLDALAHSFSPADYSGRGGGPVTGNGGIERYEMPDIFAQEA
jgi:predicted RNA-binding Zn-ribbon protein involved in translation (DUF1610 family)